MPSHNEPYTIWHLEEGEARDELETLDGRLLDLRSNPIETLREKVTGRDLVEGELRWNRWARPKLLENRYGFDAVCATLS